MAASHIGDSFSMAVSLPFVPLYVSARWAGLENCKYFAREAHRGSNAQRFGLNCQDKAHDSFPSWADPTIGPRCMHIRRLAKFNCRCCAAPVETGAWRCHCCGEAYPTSEFRAIVLSPFAIAFYVVATLAFITFWFWQEGVF